MTGYQSSTKHCSLITTVYSYCRKYCNRHELCLAALKAGCTGKLHEIGLIYMTDPFWQNSGRMEIFKRVRKKRRVTLKLNIRKKGKKAKVSS
jgi:hypothetical protein